MKPFIKPRPATPPKAPESPPPARISPNELTIFGMAATLNDPAERQAYLARACGGDAELRSRIEGRLANRGPAVPPAPAMPAELVQTVRENSLSTTNASGQRHDAVALVPMSAMQLANSQGGVRHSPVPWGVATLLAVAVGALAVFFLNEKRNREQAEFHTAAVKADLDAAEKEKDQATTSALEAKRIAELSGLKVTEAERQQALSLEEKKHALEEAAKSNEAREKALAEAKAAVAKEQAAQVEASTLRQATTAASLALADSLAKLAVLQADSGKHTAAEASARQCVELRTKAAVSGWPMIEAQTLLGAAIFAQRNKDDEARVNLLAANAAMPQLPVPTDDAEKVRADAAKKRVTQFYNSTKRRREGQEEWKKRMEAGPQ